MQTKRWYNCVDCGELVRRKRKWKAPLVCFECGVRRAEKAARQMNSKTGDAYTEWKNSAGPRGRPRLDSR